MTVSFFSLHRGLPLLSFVERALPILFYSVLYSMHEINVGFDVLSLWFIPNANGYVVTIPLCASRSRLEMNLYD